MSKIVGALKSAGNIGGTMNFTRGEKGERGDSGVYVGSGDMPADCNVQVDPEGDANIVTVGETQTLDENSEATVWNTGADGNVVLNFGIPKGRKGETGTTPLLSIGEVYQFDSSSRAEVWMSGTPENPELNFGLPRGERGDPGPQGPEGKRGEVGTTPVFSIGEVFQFDSESAANVWITGTAEAPILNLGLPKGAKGEPGRDAVLGEFELIASGKTPEAADMLNISQGDDGKPFALRDMVTIYLHSPVAAETSAITIAVNANTNTLYQIANGVKSDEERYSRAVCVYSGKRWDVYGYSASGKTSAGTITTRDRFGQEDDSIITSIKLYIYGGKDLLPAGLEYEVYGRRA